MSTALRRCKSGARSLEVEPPAAANATRPVARRGMAIPGRACRNHGGANHRAGVRLRFCNARKILVGGRRWTTAPGSGLIMVAGRGPVMLFRDRAHAARLLAERLEPYRGRATVVAGMPRGGVPMARIIADTLGADVDVVLVRKLGAPGNPELAVGAVDEHGHVFVADHAASVGATDAYLAAETARQLAVLREQRRRYTPSRPPLDPRGRTVVIVDDGIATGATMIAAVRAIREHDPARVVVAAGVAPAETVERLASEADDVVCLATPWPFDAVGRFYDDFSQVSDEEVVRALEPGRPATPA
ncbi:MAG TPA: phosphoribosyltransferase family protein [Vicinamibacterales bacterium]|nr:phosphoribosyltransferase family protein [Vicinamibacterales bacterium]